MQPKIYVFRTEHAQIYDDRQPIVISIERVLSTPASFRLNIERVVANPIQLVLMSKQIAETDFVDDRNAHADVLATQCGKI